MRLVAAAVVLFAVSPFALAAPTVLDLRIAREDGTVATLRDVVGNRPTLVAFWATYCAPCRAEVPTLNRAADRWRPQGLRVLGIALETDVARVRDAHRDWDMRYDAMPVAAGQESFTDALFPRGLPSSAVVAHGAAILHEHFLDDTAVEQLVGPLLGASAPATH